MNQNSKTNRKRRGLQQQDNNSSRQKKKTKTTNTNKHSVSLKDDDDDDGEKKNRKTVTVKIQVVPPDPTEDPILVSFPGGMPDIAGQQQQSSSSSSSFSSAPKFIWRRLNPKSTNGRVVEGQQDTGDDDNNNNGGITYRSTSLGMGYDDRRTKMCVGIYDKQSGVVKLHQTACRGTVFALQQYLPLSWYKECTTTASEEQQQQDDNNNNNDNNLSLSRKLFEDFGSAKKRKVLKSQQDNKVNVDSVIGAGSVIAESMLEDPTVIADKYGNNHDNNNTTTARGSGHQPQGGMSESNRKAVEEARRMATATTTTTSNNDNNTNLRNTTVIDSVVESAHAQARAAILPAYNLKATNVYDVYQLHTILGTDGWNFIGRIVEACLHNKEESDFYEAIVRGKPAASGTTDNIVLPPEKRGWNVSVLDCLRRVCNSGKVQTALDEEYSSEANTTVPTSARYHLSMIMVYHYLVKFYCHFHLNAKHRGGRLVPGMEEDQPKFLGIPRDAALHMFDEFTTQQINDRKTFLLPPEQQHSLQRPRREVNPNLPRYMMTKQNKDKMLTHILLVYLFARGGHKMQVDDLSLLLEDLKLEAKDSSNYLRMAGCTVNTGGTSNKTKAFLTVPLTFLKPNRGGRKK